MDNVTIYTDSRLVRKVHLDERETQHGRQPAREAWRFTLRHGTKLDNIDLSGASFLVYFKPQEDATLEAWVTASPDWEFNVSVPQRDDNGEIVKDDLGRWIFDTYRLPAADLAVAAPSYLEMESWLEVPENLVLETERPATYKDGSPMLDKKTGEQLMVKSVAIPYGTTVTALDDGRQVDVGGATTLANLVYKSDRNEGTARIHYSVGTVLKLRMPVLGEDGRQRVADGRKVWADDRLAVNAAELARKVRLVLASRAAPRQSPARKKRLAR